MKIKIKNSVIFRLNRNVYINLSIVVFLALFLLSVIEFIQYHQNILDGYSTEKQTLEHLNSLVTDVGESILKILIMQEEEVLQILTKSEDFQAAFDAFHDAVIKRKSLSELSLAREFEPMITALRRDIVFIIHLYKKNDFQAAKDHYSKIFVMRTNHIKRFTNDETYLLDNLIENKIIIMSKFRSYTFIFITIVTLLVSSLVIVFNKKTTKEITKAITHPMKELGSAMSAIAKGDYGYKIDIEHDDEFSTEFYDLCIALNAMSGEIQKSQESLMEAKIAAETFQSQLIESSKMASLGAMSSGIAHELNQPLGAILLKAQLIIKLIDKGDIEKVRAINENIMPSHIPQVEIQ